MQNTHISSQIRALHGALLDIVSVINRPQVDDVVLTEAGLSLERALFPLLVAIARFGPIGVVDLAERVGRDYTTVSRQLTRLESLGLATRSETAKDRRVKAAATTAAGRQMVDAVDAARDRLGRQVLADWTAEDIEDLVRLLRRFADALGAGPRPSKDA